MCTIHYQLHYIKVAFSKDVQWTPLSKDTPISKKLANTKVSIIYEVQRFSRFYSQDHFKQHCQCVNFIITIP